WITGIATLRPHWRVTGRWPREGAHELAVGRELARRLAADPARPVLLECGARREPWTVTGVIDGAGTDESRAVAPLEPVQALGDRGGQIDRRWLRARGLPPPRRPAPDRTRDPAGYERYMCAAYPTNVAPALAAVVPGSEVQPMTEVVAGEGAVVGRLNRL